MTADTQQFPVAPISENDVITDTHIPVFHEIAPGAPDDPCWASKLPPRDTLRPSPLPVITTMPPPYGQLVPVSPRVYEVRASDVVLWLGGLFALVSLAAFLWGAS